MVAGIKQQYAPEDLIGGSGGDRGQSETSQVVWGSNPREWVLAASVGGDAEVLGDSETGAEWNPYPVTETVQLQGIIDSHCHLQTLEPELREAHLDEARERGVVGFLVPAIKPRRGRRTARTL